MPISFEDFMRCVDDSLIIPPSRNERFWASQPDSKADSNLDTFLDDLEDEVVGDESKVMTAAKVDPVESTISHTVPTTQFPVSDPWAIATVFDPLSRLSALIAELDDHQDYARIRDGYCELSILLNLQGALAPGFRPNPRRAFNKGNPVFLEIHRDQIVIDLHWLNCNEEPIRARDSKFQPLFDSSKPFPFDRAWEFANLKWKKAHRTDEALCLTPRQQCQLASMQGVDVAARHELAMRGTRAAGVRIRSKISVVRQRLAHWAECDKRMAPLVVEYENLD